MQGVYLLLRHIVELIAKAAEPLIKLRQNFPAFVICIYSLVVII